MKAEWRVCQKSNQYAPKGQKHIARGTALGKKYRKYQCALQGKSLIINAFAPTGRFAFINPYTQGGALGYELIGLSARIIDF